MDGKNELPDLNDNAEESEEEEFDPEKIYDEVDDQTVSEMKGWLLGAKKPNHYREWEWVKYAFSKTM